MIDVLAAELGLGLILGVVLGLMNVAYEESRLNNYLLGILLSFIYYMFCEPVFKVQTLGKLLTGTRVVNGNGEVPDVSRIFIRTLCRFIPFDAFSFFTSNPVGWYDSLSKTFVVDEKRVKVEIENNQRVNTM